MSDVSWEDIQPDFDAFQSSLLIHGLVLNAEKTKHMLFSMSMFNLKIKNQTRL